MGLKIEPQNDRFFPLLRYFQRKQDVKTRQDYDRDESSDDQIRHLFVHQDGSNDANNVHDDRDVMDRVRRERQLLSHG